MNADNVERILVLVEELWKEIKPYKPDLNFASFINTYVISVPGLYDYTDKEFEDKLLTDLASHVKMRAIDDPRSRN